MDESRTKSRAIEGRGSRASATSAADNCEPKKQTRSAKPPAIVAAAVTFKALSDETRLRILQLLGSSEKELCACDIEEQFSLTQPTISHHMKILRGAGLVSAEKRGAWVYYSVEAAGERALSAAESLTAPVAARPKLSRQTAQKRKKPVALR